MDALTAELSGRGLTWREIATDYQIRFKLTPLRSFREAHRYTQAKVVALWNARWPDDMLNERRLRAWESWPGPAGNEPPLSSLERLARLYQCRAGDLVGGDDHGHPGRHDSARHSPMPGVDQPAPTQPSLSPAGVASFLDGLPALAPGGTADPPDRHVPAEARLREQEFGYLVSALTQWADGMKRRDLLGVIAAAAAAASASPLLAHLDESELERLALTARSRSRVDTAAVDHVEAILHHVMRQEDSLGPQAVMETVLAQQSLVRRLLQASAAPGLHRRLMTLFADISRFMGWLHFNAGDFAGADHYYGQALRAAHEADDDLMSSYILAQRSHLATWTGDPRQGVEHALGALMWAQRGGSDILVAYAQDVGARAYAGVLRRERARAQGKDYGRCRTAMAASRTGLAASCADDPGRRLVYFFEPNLLTLTSALCQLDMLNPGQAIADAEEAIAATAERFPRNRAFGHLYLSRAYTQKREIAQACAELVQVARLTGRNRSQRVVTAVTDARVALSPWNRTDAVTGLDEQLRDYGVVIGRSRT
ncbi:hypothetical protein [Microbispora triticiradicis]|uniref:XRE family transcriptional regulator n=2 Tax=Microbispora TaxID=2005 RepID=A0ABY3LWA0_9ACTN|nr:MULTISPECIES: hypothetical protein [Microbispora]TYB57559.1 hypothetical protein FXF59_18590 [Microbispora tritici]